VNGNTQVNATELRALPLPPLEIIKSIGEKVEHLSEPVSEQVDAIIFSILWQTNLLAEEFPMIQETRITMGKIEQAQEILEAFGLPPAQQNEISALTLLSLSQLAEDTDWKKASSKSMRVHDILVEIKQKYGREYAENSRETIRRKVLHQFEQGGLVVRNGDDPERPTNSGLTNYAMSELALDVIRSYGTPKWTSTCNFFIEKQGSTLSTRKRTDKNSLASGRRENIQIVSRQTQQA
jgi:adenine-specific DNA-methyltransferase